MEWQDYVRAGLQAHARGQFEDADELLEKALYLAEDFGFEDPRLSTTLIYYATNAIARGELEEAHMVLSNTLEQLTDIDQESQDLDLNRATCLNNLGLIAKQNKDFAEAEKHYQQALIILERHKARGHPILTATRSNIAVLYMLQDAFKEAELLLLECLEDEAQYTARNGRDNPGTIPAGMHQLATAYHAQGKLEQAEEIIDRVIEHWDKTGWPAHRITESVLSTYRDILEEMNRFAEATSVEARLRALKAERERESS